MALRVIVRCDGSTFPFEFNEGYLVTDGELTLYLVPDSGPGYGWYTVRVPESPDVLTEGKTLDDCFKAARDCLESVEDSVFTYSTPRCGFVPPTPGYGPCTRNRGHEGPCAHPLAPEPEKYPAILGCLFFALLLVPAAIAIFLKWYRGQ